MREGNTFKIFYTYRTVPWYYNAFNGQPPYTGTSTYASKTRVKWRNPSYTDGFRLSKKNNTLLPLPYYVRTNILCPLQGTTTTWLLQGVGNWVLHWKNPGLMSWYASEPVFGLRPPSIAYITNRLLQSLDAQLLAVIKDQKVNLLQAYAEANSTLTLLRDTTSKVALMYSRLRAGDLKGAAAAVGYKVSKRRINAFRTGFTRSRTPSEAEEVLSRGILSIQYGWRPLLSDVVGLAQLTAQKAEREMAYKVVTVKKLSQESVTDVYSYKNTNVTQFAQWTATVKVTKRISYSVQDDVFNTFKQIGLTNIPQVGWELIPWSFVIDWFIPIGNWLSSLDATYGLQFRYGSLSVRESEWVVRNQVLRTNTANTRISGVGSGSESDERFTRTPLTSFPTPSLPRFKSPLSLEHAINGIALLVGLKASLKKSIDRGTYTE